MRSRWPARGAVLIAGALSLVAFPAPGLDLLAWVALVPVLLLLRAADTPREAALRGWLAGVGFLSGTQYWLAPNLVYFFPFVIGLVALLWSGWGILVRALLRGAETPARAVAAVIGVPAGWVLIETVRSWHWLGGPWSLFGSTQWRRPDVLALASVGGVWLVGFAVVAANVGFAILIVGGRTWAWSTPPTSARCVGAATALVAVVVGPLWSAARSDLPDSPTVPVALVQPGIVHDDLLSRQEELTRGLGRPVHLVVWGESSVGEDLTARPDVLARLTALSGAVGAELLVNVDARVAGGAIAKTSTLISGEGIEAEYRKTRLVPFGEYVPFRGQLGWLSRVTAAAGQNRQAGEKLVVMDVDGLAIGPLISFEQTFPDLARAQSRNGAALLVYQSSTATFQGSWAPAQLASFGALRAAETGRPVAAAALTGVSAAFDARGNRLAWMPAAESGALIVDVPMAGEDTAFDRLGNWVPASCALIVALLALGGLARRRSSG
ncbi:apolipoprotein N-acyltransferase [Rhodococcus maanshanensis]|uniref:Apolipoprotein N-acyltransferase n=1 Tax=Rhodococcus maanshanensis TaxID=183556 RepID=A0A1H7SYL0_9NOCA|nr:apolipoprotein N-acyltransferase [Rhodococcus maanshanensis]SEL77732.1 apolipoprotein N-acyltransferase [Rhodococcus maanshanensis]